MKTNACIYLDNNATTAVAPEVVEVITKALSSKFANASSVHSLGAESGRELTRARESIARTLGCDADEIIFTSSGSEANSLAILGFCRANADRGNHIIVSPIEHPSVDKAVKQLQSEGFTVSYLTVDGEGFVNPDEILSLARPETILCSVMHANNEIGTIQNIHLIAEICQHLGVTFHTDAVQSYGKVHMDMRRLSVAMASFSGHKIHAPKGIGFLFRRRGLRLQPVICGGGQEFGLRAGTENLPYILGLARACELLDANDIARMRSLQRSLISSLIELPGLRINGPISIDQRVCNNINFSIEHSEGERILKKLDVEGIYVSTGSACSSKSTKISPVLKAIKCPVNYIHGNLRVSLSRYTTEAEVAEFVGVLKRLLVKQPRGLWQAFSASRQGNRLTLHPSGA